MRLIWTGPEDLRMEEFSGTDVPCYAILSHRWADDAAEISLQDFIAGRKRDTSGFRKIVQCCRLAKSLQIDWVWIDTCCIDKTSSAELSESINSMYAWYDCARYCFVFLQEIQADLDSSIPSFPIGDLHPDDRDHVEQRVVKEHELPGTEQFRVIQEDHVRNSKQPKEVLIKKLPETSWFTRGWTLQELLAGERVLFFDRKLNYLGSRQTLAVQISEHTTIPVEYLSTPQNLEYACVAQKLSWASDRKTKRPEDTAYCLMGIFNVNMPLLYGEGLEKAFRRLQTQILEQRDDDSIFAWRSEQPHNHNLPPFSLSGLFAKSPNDFRRSGRIRHMGYDPLMNAYRLVNQYIEADINRPSFPLFGWNLTLNCYDADQENRNRVQISLCTDPCFATQDTSEVASQKLPRLCRADSRRFEDNTSRSVLFNFGSFLDSAFGTYTAPTKVVIHNVGSSHQDAPTILQSTYFNRTSLVSKIIMYGLPFAWIFWIVLVCSNAFLDMQDNSSAPFFAWALLEICLATIPESPALRRSFVFAVYGRTVNKVIDFEASKLNFLWHAPMFCYCGLWVCGMMYPEFNSPTEGVSVAPCDAQDARSGTQSG